MTKDEALCKLIAMLREEIAHATVNGHHLSDLCQGVGPGEKPPAVRVDRIEVHLRAAEAALAESEQEQEPVAFDHSIGEGRFQVVRGAFWWHIKIGDSEALYGKFHSKLAAEDMALKLLTAYRDGAFEQYNSHPFRAEPLTDEEIEACIDEANVGFNRHRSSTHGQICSTWDDWKHWLARAVERKLRGGEA